MFAFYYIESIPRAYENTMVPMVCVGLYHHISNNLDILENVGSISFLEEIEILA